MISMNVTASVVASMDVAFGPLFALPPIVSIIVFSAILSVITLALGRILMKKGFAKETREKTKLLNDTMKRAQKEGNKELVDSNMKELLGLNSKYMKESMKLMVGSLIVGITFLFYMSSKYAGVTVALPLIGWNINWIYWYVITSMIITMVMKKATGEM